MLGVNPAVTANDKVDRQSQNPAVALGKIRISYRDRVVDFELLVESADRLRVVIQRDPNYL